MESGFRGVALGVRVRACAATPERVAMSPLVSRPSRVHLAWMALAAVVTVGATALVVPTRPAIADPLESSTTTTGAIVAVDFGPWGGSVLRGCDATPTTGLDLLHEAGFATTGTVHDGPGAPDDAIHGTVTLADHIRSLVDRDRDPSAS